MQVQKETVTEASQKASPSDDLDSGSGVLSAAKARLSPARFELLERTLRVRRVIGKVSPEVAELVHEMREQGA